MKVLHLITTLGPGGIERWLLSMLAEIPRATCAMDICCKGNSIGPYAPAAKQLGADVLHVKLGVTQIGYLSGLRQLISKEGYDVVHNHLQSYSGLAAFVCKSLNVPVITSFHCTAFPPETWLRQAGLRQLREIYSNLNVRYALHHSNMLTGCSQSVVDTIRDSYGGSNGTGWRVLYYGTDLPPLATSIERRDFRAQHGWRDDIPVVVHIGRFSQQKNHDGLIDIFELVLRRTPNAKLLLVGGGPLRGAIEAKVRRHGLSEAVVFLGYREDVPAILARSDVFLFPSWFEGMGIAALEASAAAIPVVASDIPAIAEAVEDGVTGYLRDPKDPVAIADAVEAILSDAELARQMGAAGRSRIERKFSKCASADSLLRIYHECLSRSRCGLRHSGDSRATGRSSSPGA